MIKRRTIGLAAATAVLGGLGAYGATTAFATPSAEPTPSPTQTSETGRHADIDTDSMIRHCTDQLPAADRAEARQLMENMMSNGMMSGDMMPGTGDGGQPETDSPSGTG
ncbi:hypothetical protein ABZ078_33225 [Streptomyces sp. NPDC006385]|uniref:hypothetical protein n=1 Tax=Streptomyces sp. NPDC006385 TaxID=3156761 RepID=UPI0033B59092